ncbi:hypothetical protein, partial [Lactobacillus sp.]|uniref:hypothetical protein n=1 Tax=Lactobacillus sp. TaxID=1591 RepID=UPI003F0D51B3
SRFGNSLLAQPPYFILGLQLAAFARIAGVCCVNRLSRLGRDEAAEELADHPAFNFDSAGLLPVFIFGLDEDRFRGRIVGK